MTCCQIVYDFRSHAWPVGIRPQYQTDDEIVPKGRQEPFQRNRQICEESLQPAP